jgi:folate-binding protein YgfZ
MIPAASLLGYDAARHRSAFIDRSDRGRIVVSGADRASYLHGLFTNDIAALKAGQGCYAAYLTAQGRMIADFYVYNLGDVILLTMAARVKDTVLAKLDRFIFSEDVQIGDVTDTFAQIGIVGPDAASVVAGWVTGTSVETLAALPEHGNVRVRAIVTRVTDAGEPGFDVYVERAEAPALLTAIAAAGAVRLDDQAAEAIRIEAGVPQFGRDIDEDTIPLEAGIEGRAISFTKGCYVGQEVIIRVMHRGHGRVARRLVGLVLSGDQSPASGATIRAGDREVGAVTSGTWSPELSRPIALGYVHRDFVEPGTPVSVDGSTAEVVALPFTRGK